MEKLETDEQVCLGGSEVFSNAEFYHLRNCLVEIIEEVKLRRGNDAESEERIKLLVNEKYQLERRCDAEVGQLSTIREQHQRHVTDLERSLQEKMRLLEEENKQLKVYRKCGEKETESLKDSVRSLQLSKYSLEKSLREQEHKLQSHLSSSDQQLGELSALEQKLRSMTVHFQQLSNSQERLEKNVTEAVKLNRSLMYVNEHQKCVMEQQKADLHRCQQQVVTLSTQLESKPVITADMEELNQRLTALQHHTNLAVDQRCALEKELDHYKTRYKVSLDDLHEMHNLVQRHLDNADQHRFRNAELEEVNQTLKSRVKLGEEKVDKLQQELDVERVDKAEAITQWNKQEETLKTDLETLKRDLTATNETRTSLETLNHQLEESKTWLTQQYQELKAIVDREKTESIQQTSLSYFNNHITATQTENETAAVSTQTVLDTADNCVQTHCETNSASSQTHSQCVSSSSQTIVPPLANSSVQTERQEITEHALQRVSGEVGHLSQEGKIVGSELKSVDTQENSVSAAHKAVAPELEIDMNNDSGSDVDSCIILEDKTTDIPNNCDSNSLKSDTTCKEDVLISAVVSANNSTMTVSQSSQDFSTQPRKNVSNSDTSGTSSSSFDSIQFIPLNCYKLEQQSERRRLSLPVARHNKQMLCKNSPLPKSLTHSESDSCFYKNKPRKVSQGSSRGMKTRYLYSESPLLWGAPCPDEEPVDMSRQSSTSEPNTSAFASVSKKWSDLVETEEQAKNPAPSPGKSPRSTPKMGLRILSEASPSRRRSTGFEGIQRTQLLIEGFESRSHVSSGKKQGGKHHDEGQRPSAADGGRKDREYRSRSPQHMSPKAHRGAQDLIESQKTKISPRTKSYLSEQRYLRLQASTTGPYEMSEGTSFYVGKKADANNKQQDKSPRNNSKGILKAAWSAKKPFKTVRFGSIMVSQAQPDKASLPTVSSVSPSQNRPVGEQLLFSDDDDDFIDTKYGNNLETSPTVQPRKRKREDGEDKT